ncbi:RagB/SusD family nutrient uptake outer membrane protein [Algibacter amylolyticus]|uniref:RagB/SusD family nutrient uptake outer membrane protein n=1 Tax=Algibacter amylolyticus TaxID=1608400 RepID=A0A5M7B4I8_9FLAO|nr:RagB/SusD family nutrient uptake outer membrane protein [Algibacter amylolyticus]KAA5823680.1 RagB/SusD family nutrient uptake outer membrane protein [Algibacter amylolyticus]MBB5267847.1 hypothetical protein [Algibacter amylolyticus]TSJ74168.1 RagB/SusD family nutrient uptake outer membrane protein [Algibacter amylolyticus]
MKKIIIFTAIISLFWSCNEDFLQEESLDQLTSESAFITYEDFNASVSNLYYLVRRQYFNRDENRPFDFLYGTDIVYDGENNGSQRHSRMEAAYDPSGQIATVHWNLLYKTISEANTVINRVGSSNLTDEQAIDILSQARFFRAFSYRSLVYLYGDVPLITEEITAPKVDFTRQPKSQVLDQIIEDFDYASKNLPKIAEAQDGKLNNLVAYHYLAETYISTGKNTEAITAASVVINDPATDLMKRGTRFGSRANEPGNIYWDLFRTNNQNRTSGNTEGLWVIQFELDVLGGGLQSGSKGGSYMLERHHGPLIRDVRLIDPADNRRRPPFNWPVGDYSGGRGIGWMISTTYFSNTIWGGDSSNPDFVNDIRNSNENFVREYVANRAPFEAEIVSTENPQEGYTVPSRAIYAYQTKATTPFNHPDGLYNNSDTFSLSAAAGGTYTDQYMLRLAETYLLRAEAYLADSNPGLAAQDINVIRDRANASPVSPGDVTIDYILDERMRELGLEEKRRLTLMRLGLLYDRVSRFNPYYVEQGMKETYNLWPIPANEIERNRGAVLKQNPGYPGAE